MSQQLQFNSFADIFKNLFPGINLDPTSSPEQVERRFVANVEAGNVEVVNLDQISGQTQEISTDGFIQTGEFAPDDFDPPRWFNSLGDEVDLDDIDRNYALKILAMLLNRGRSGHDPLVQKVLDVALNGREPNAEDSRRAFEYSRANAERGLPFRA